MSLTPVYWFIRSRRSMNSQQKAAECMLDFATPARKSQSMQKNCSVSDTRPVASQRRCKMASPTEVRHTSAGSREINLDLNADTRRARSRAISRLTVR